MTTKAPIPATITANLSQKYLKFRLKYDLKTGIFIWLKHRDSTIIGTLAGSINTAGYSRISIDGIRYQSHRLAYLYVKGCFPNGPLDHRNHQKDDNIFTNLRFCSFSQNGGNSVISKNNTSGMKGCSWDKERQIWKAKIMKDRKNIFIGRYDDLVEAAEAYNVKATLLFGDFALLNEIPS